ncbi:MAG: low molecular weight protein-tyrosine-phosphatase [Burkholderiaceae bacterium]
MPSVLFVCLGNICRSPTAEVVLKARLPEFGLVRSAGTRAVGGAIDARAAAALARHDYKAEKRFRSRQVEAADFDRYDLIVAMDGRNLEDLRALAPAGAPARLQLLLDFVPELAGRDVPDPYYGPAAGFDQAIALIERGIEGLAQAWQRGELLR